MSNVQESEDVMIKKEKKFRKKIEERRKPKRREVGGKGGLRKSEN